MQLFRMVERDAVQWPKDMSSTFQNFLQGLLVKNPQQRLAWPQLLDHPFVKDLVQGCFMFNDLLLRHFCMLFALASVCCLLS